MAADKKKKRKKRKINLEGISLTLKRKRIVITLDGDKYAIIEASGATRDGFLNGVINRSDKNDQIKNVLGIQASLIARCLVRVTSDGDEAVGEKTIQTWPAPTVKDLFEACQQLSGMDDDDDDEDEDAEGND